MKSRRVIILSFVALICNVACAQFTMQLPMIPDSLRTPQTRASWLLSNYWEKADFTVVGSGDAALEQAFVDYLTLLPIVESDSVRFDAFKRLMECSRYSVEVANLAEKYLHTPESPLSNEDYYMQFLNAALRISDLRLIAKDGKTTSLADIASETEADLLLFVYSSDCDNCTEAIKEMAADEIMLDKIRNGSLRVIAIDIEIEAKGLKTFPFPCFLCQPASGVSIESIFLLRNVPAKFLVNNKLEFIKK